MKTFRVEQTDEHRKETEKYDLRKVGNKDRQTDKKKTQTDKRKTQTDKRKTQTDKRKRQKT